MGLLKPTKKGMPYTVKPYLTLPFMLGFEKY